MRFDAVMDKRCASAGRTYELKYSVSIVDCQPLMMLMVDYQAALFMDVLNGFLLYSRIVVIRYCK